MRTDEKIARLEGLLERVRRNASVPRERFSTVDEAELEPADGAATMAEAETSVVEIDEPVAAIEYGDVEEIEVEELDLTDEEIVDLTDAEELGREPEPEPEPERAPMAADAESLDWEEEVEEPPVSSQRPIAATSMDEALAGVADHVEMEEGREIPLKTPPPESGPQEAPLPQMSAPAIPELDEADIASAPPAVQGEALLELDEPSEATLEVEEAEIIPPAPQSGEIAPQVVERPAIAAASPSEYVSAVRGYSPVSFVELLDESLGLRAD